MTAPDPLAETRQAARQMLKIVGAVDADMAARPWAWKRGYGSEVAAALSGPAAAMAAPWDQETVRAVAGWLEATAKQAADEVHDYHGWHCDQCGYHLTVPCEAGCCERAAGCRCWDAPLAVARAYLASTSTQSEAEK